MYTIYTNARESGWWETDVFTELAKRLNSRGIPTGSKRISSFNLRRRLFTRTSIEFHHSLAFIQHEKSGKFYVLDCHDWETPFDIDHREIVNDDRCQILLKCQYRAELFDQRPLMIKIRPWTYFEGRSLFMQARLRELRHCRRTQDRLYFRGTTKWGGRAPILEYLQRRALINSSFDLVGYEQYLKESCENRLILALPGMGNICHREIEGFGLGTPVLMPRLKNRVHNNLVPDHHYISVAADTQNDNAERVADRIQERFEQVIRDRNYLDFVAHNAMEWYEANVRFPQSLDLTISLLGLRERDS